MTQHHAIRGNLADVSAKDSAQETAVNLIASIAALLIISVFGYLFFILIVIDNQSLLCINPLSEQGNALSLADIN